MNMSQQCIGCIAMSNIQGARDNLGILLNLISEHRDNIEAYGGIYRVSTKKGSFSVLSQASQRSFFCGHPVCIDDTHHV